MIPDRGASASGRELCVTFPTSHEGVLDPTAQGHWDALVIESGGAVDLGKTYCGQNRFNTRSHSEPGGLLGMATNPVQTSGGVLMLDVGGELRWRLLWDDQFSGGASDNGLCITFDADNTTWTLTGDEHPECGSVDSIVNLVRNVEPGFVHVTKFDIPFSFTVTPEP